MRDEENSKTKLNNSLTNSSVTENHNRDSKINLEQRRRNKNK